MKKLKNNGKINFIVNIHHGYGEVLTGGVVAMHYLAYLLAKEGHNVYMFTQPQYPHKNIQILKSWVVKKGGGSFEDATNSYNWESFSYLYSNTVAIYPETTFGNWFGTHHIVRWLLYPSDKFHEDTWGENDYCFTYGKQKSLTTSFKGKDSQELIAMNFYLDDFKNENRESRSGFCHLLHKHTSPNAKTFLNELNSTSLSDWKTSGTHKYLNEQFNKHEYFICYDQLSFWPQMAALCGCKVVVMNVKDNPNTFYDYNTTPEQYRLENPLKKYGVAFGFEDLQYAIDTQHLVEDHLKEMNEYNLQTVKDFVKFWEKKCYA
jgi:hypothetical protein